MHHPSVGSLIDLRLQLHDRSECQFVERDEYVQHAVSARRLLRADEPAARVRGLLDPTTGLRLLIEEEKLIRAETP